jgi:hypothetical protein
MLDEGRGIEATKTTTAAGVVRSRLVTNDLVLRTLEGSQLFLEGVVGLVEELEGTPNVLGGAVKDHLHPRDPGAGGTVEAGREGAVPVELATGVVVGTAGAAACGRGLEDTANAGVA